MALPRNQWKTAEVDDDQTDSLAKDLGVPRPLAIALLSRGIDSPREAEKFLNPRLSDISDPFDLPDMLPAVERIWAAIDNGSKITIFGDYDADGITSTALATSFLRKMGGDVSYFLPERMEDGYGLTQTAFDRCVDIHKPDLIITVDCGTGSTDVLKNARERGLDVVVTDHHTPPEVLPETLANINPRISGNPATADLAGVGVAFKLCYAVLKWGISNSRAAVKEVDLREWLDLVALGTVADIVPLLGENRILVRHGLARINTGANLGLRALKDVTRLKGDVDTHGIGFVLGPRINAAGRVGNPSLALELLLADNEARAEELAKELNRFNDLRKKTESGVVSEAKKAVELYFDKDKNFGIVAAGEGWHTGVIGIVASRLVGTYGRPSIVIGIDENGVGQGSCRSIDGINILEILSDCSELMEHFGGHAAAAGLSIKRENIDAFRERFSTLCSERLQGVDSRPCIQIDAWIAPGEFGEALCAASNKLQPCGRGNPAPLWGLKDASVLGEARVIGKDGKHLKMTLGAGASQIDAVAFGFAEFGVPEGAVNVVFEIDRNTYMGRTTVQMKIKDADW